MKAFVPAAEIADQVLVSAMTEEGTAVFIVDRGAQGVVLEALVTTSRMPESMMTLEGVVVAPDAILGQAGAGR